MVVLGEPLSPAEVAQMLVEADQVRGPNLQFGTPAAPKRRSTLLNPPTRHLFGCA